MDDRTYMPTSPSSRRSIPGTPESLTSGGSIQISPDQSVPTSELLSTFGSMGITSNQLTSPTMSATGVPSWRHPPPGTTSWIPSRQGTPETIHFPYQGSNTPLTSSSLPGLRPMNPTGVLRILEHLTEHRRGLINDLDATDRSLSFWLGQLEQARQSGQDASGDTSTSIQSSTSTSGIPRQSTPSLMTASGSLYRARRVGSGRRGNLMSQTSIDTRRPFNGDDRAYSFATATATTDYEQRQSMSGYEETPLR